MKKELLSLVGEMGCFILLGGVATCILYAINSLKNVTPDMGPGIGFVGLVGVVAACSSLVSLLMALGSIRKILFQIPKCKHESRDLIKMEWGEPMIYECRFCHKILIGEMFGFKRPKQESK